MERIIQNTVFLSNFLGNLKTIFSLNKSLAIDATNFSSFEIDKLPGERATGVLEKVINKLKDDGIKYDLIFESLPFGMKLMDWERPTGKKLKLPLEYAWILESLKYIEDSGILLAILPPNILICNEGKEFEQVLNSIGFYYSAVFNLPDHFWEPNTSIQSILLVIKKGWSEKLFISELDYSSDYETILVNYFKGLSKSLEEGIFITRGEFTSFENHKSSQKIKKLQKQYSSYIEYDIGQIAKGVNTTKTNFIEIENSLYIPKIGTTLPISNLYEATLKHQNYFQVILEPDIVNAQYLEIFFKSQMGLLILRTLKKMTFIPHVNKSDLLKVKIPIPDFETQILIVQTNQKIRQLKEEIKDFESQLSLNPNSANEIQGILKNTLDSLGKLNEEDQILEIIRQGESKKLEFKQTFSKDVDTNIKDKEKIIRESSLKNIVAFLNSEGGILLIGIKDNGEIYGIENDYFLSDDKYLLNFKNNVKDHIGEDAYPFLDWNIVTVLNKKVLRVDCKISTSEPFFLNGSDFYVRTNPSADKLVGPKMMKYIEERFHK